MNKPLQYLIQYILILSTLCALILAASLLIGKVAAADLVDNGFETGTFGGMSPHGGGIETIVKSPVASGSYAANFDLINGYPASTEQYRAEAWFSDSKGNFAFEKEYWFSFNYRYEDWAIDSNAEIAPFQIHTRPSQWTSNCQFNNAVGYAPFLMLSQNDEVRFYTYPGKISWRAKIQKQKWQTITVHFKISTGSTGFIEAWKDSVKLFRVDGANSPKTDACGGLMREPFFNMGIYKWDWKRKITDSKRRQLFIDDLKIAQGPIPEPTVPPDTAPPLISAVVVEHTCSLATVKWVTDEPTIGEVAIGRSDVYGEVVRDPIMVTRHQVQFPIVPDGLDWWVRIDSVDVAGNKAVPIDRRFVVQ